MSKTVPLCGMLRKNIDHIYYTYFGAKAKFKNKFSNDSKAILFDFKIKL